MGDEVLRGWVLRQWGGSRFGMLDGRGSLKKRASGTICWRGRCLPVGVGLCEEVWFVCRDAGGGGFSDERKYL